MIATQLHVPLYSTTDNPTEFAIRCGQGHRLSPSGAPPAVLLLVDDTTAVGGALRKARAKLQDQFPAATILTAVVYATPQTMPMVDYAAVELPLPHYLSHNLGNSGYLVKCAFDMDGVLCEDPQPGDDDDGERYAAFLKNTKPLMLPRRAPVECIITGRLEKYRKQTEEWLAKYKIQCKRLIMPNWQTPAERFGKIGLFKGGCYAATPFALFVESHPIQAQQIAEISRKPVLCPMLGRVVWAASQGNDCTPVEAVL